MFPDGLVTFPSFEVDEVCHSEVAIQLFLALAARVLLEALAVVVLIEEQDPSWDEFEGGCLLQLFLLLLAFGQRLV